MFTPVVSCTNTQRKAQNTVLLRSQMPATPEPSPSRPISLLYKQRSREPPTQLVTEDITPLEEHLDALRRAPPGMLQGMLCLLSRLLLWLYVLPTLHSPSVANGEQYLKNGAGKGVGLSVTTGSQDGTSVSGGMSSGIASAGSGTASGAAEAASGTATPSASATNSSKNAGSSLQPLDGRPFVISFIVVGFSLVGGLLL